MKIGIIVAGAVQGTNKKKKNKILSTRSVTYC